jgi:rhodanese-related sulfurtransferase/rubrerythrin
MGWKEFFRPTKAMTAEEARAYIEESPDENIEILDVRQPKEYREGHIPGAKLIPLPQLTERLDEIDPSKPVLTYCAVGGRSRAAAQTLAGKGYQEVYNIKGGYKAWQGHAAFGPEETGLELFSGLEGIDDVLLVAYGLEQGLKAFYLDLAGKVQNEAVVSLFHKLAGIEEKHKQRIFAEYKRLASSDVDQATLEQQTVAPAMEGGLSTQEYLKRLQPDLDSPSEVIDLAMAIEAQALDLYARAAQQSEEEQSVRFLQQLASEEKAHLQQLGELMEKV